MLHVNESYIKQLDVILQTCYLFLKVDYLLNITKFHNGTTSAMEEPGGDLNCSEFFYYNRMNGICRVECNWNPLRTSAQLSVIIGSSFSAIAILVSPIYILLAFTVQRSW